MSSLSALIFSDFEYVIFAKGLCGKEMKMNHKLGTVSKTHEFLMKTQFWALKTSAKKLNQYHKHYLEQQEFNGPCQEWG